MSASANSIAATILVLAAAGAARAESQVERGRYLVSIMDCGGCHTTGELGGHPEPGHMLAGAKIGWAIPGVGIVTPPNLTGDVATGLGNWTSDDIVKLLRTGVRPDGREIVGPMGWRAYAQMTDPDIRAVAAYLKSLPPVVHAVPGPTPIADFKGAYFTVAHP